jgi:hypothetical protein
MRDQMRGGGEDVAGRTVIAFQANDLGAGKIVLETQDVVDLGAAPAIDRLVVIADAADVLGGRLLPLPALVRRSLESEGGCGVATSFARAERVGVGGLSSSSN